MTVILGDCFIRVFCCLSEVSLMIDHWGMITVLYYLLLNQLLSTAALPFIAAQMFQKSFIAVLSPGLKCFLVFKYSLELVIKYS